MITRRVGLREESPSTTGKGEAVAVNTSLESVAVVREGAELRDVLRIVVRRAHERIPGGGYDGACNNKKKMHNTKRIVLFRINAYNEPDLKQNEAQHLGCYLSRRHRSWLLYLCYVFRVLINSLVHRFCIK